jgi:hypothetical protein
MSLLLKPGGILAVAAGWPARGCPRTFRGKRRVIANRLPADQDVLGYTRQAADVLHAPAEWQLSLWFQHVSGA